MSIAEVIAVLTGVGGLIVSIYAALSSARKNEVDILRGIIAELRQEIKGLEKEIEAWKCRFERLVEWVNSKGLNPPDFLD